MSIITEPFFKDTHFFKSENTKKNPMTQKNDYRVTLVTLCLIEERLIQKNSHVVFCISISFIKQKNLIILD